MTAIWDVTTRVRRWFFAMPGRLVRSGRRVRLRLPAVGTAWAVSSMSMKFSPEVSC